MVEMYFWGAVLRFLQIVVQSAPTILVGLLLTGVFRRLLGAGQTRRLFGDGTWRSLPTAWLLGMLLPVCSLGVLPVVREMRRAGVSGGAILAFALTAPLFNPVSLLYGLTLSAPIVIFTFAICSIHRVWTRPDTRMRLTPIVARSISPRITCRHFGAKCARRSCRTS